MQSSKLPPSVAGRLDSNPDDEDDKAVICKSWVSTTRLPTLQIKVGVETVVGMIRYRRKLNVKGCQLVKAIQVDSRALRAGMLVNVGATHPAEGGVCKDDW